VFKLIFKHAKPRKVYKITLTEAIVQMVKAGLGVSVLPNWIVKPYIESGELVALPITRKGIKRVWYAATLENKEQPPYMNAFIGKLARHLKCSEDLAMYAYN
jgi:LysR family transcriptional regulator for metE and metH